MKRFLTASVAAFLLALSLSWFAGCNKTPEKKVMNISCNPSVEFVLDGQNKVISANALNEEGNLIITARTFVGKEADVAAKLFVEVSKETGFILSGNVKSGENEIEISLSGDGQEVQNLFNEVKDTVNEYLTAENITATLAQSQAITKEYLEKLVAESQPYMKEAEIKALEYMELVEELYESRRETAELYSQELKNAYYEAKAFVLQQAEIEALKSKVPSISQIAVEASYQAYALAVDTIENIRLTQLVNEDSPYQLALKAFREAKVDYLKYRENVAAMEEGQITAAVEQALNSYKVAVDNAEQAVISAGQTANRLLDEVRTRINDAYNLAIEKIEEFSVRLSDHLTDVTKKQAQAKAEFFEEFETAYSEAISAARSNWTAMKTELETKTAA